VTLCSITAVRRCIDEGSATFSWFDKSVEAGPGPACGFTSPVMTTEKRRHDGKDISPPGPDETGQEF
jgi:hypothetical protein